MRLLAKTHRRCYAGQIAAKTLMTLLILRCARHLAQAQEPSLLYLVRRVKFHIVVLHLILCLYLDPPKASALRIAPGKRA